MLKLAISNIWNRRGRYGWLFIELIVVTVLSWIVLDRLLVLTYQYNRPLGYDADRLVVMTTEEVRRRDETFVPDRDCVTDFYALLGYVRSLPEVDKATLGFYDGIESNGGLIITSTDSIGRTMVQHWMHFPLNQDFFSTYGIKGAGGIDNSDYLSGISESGMVLTSRMAEILYPGKNPFLVCDSLFEDYMSNNENNPNILSTDQPMRLLGLVDEFRPWSTEPGSFAFRLLSSGPDRIGDKIVMRLHENIDRDEFVTQLRGRIDEFRRGNIRASMIQSQREIMTVSENRKSGPERRLDSIFTVFFLLNVCLGVSGTFWMMTSRRASEIGVLRAFGSTPGRVRSLLLAEASVLTVLSWIVGCGLYFVYAWQRGLYLGATDDFTHTWVESFPLHFALVSGLILVLLFLAVTLGVAGPGWKLSRVNPVDALRSE